MLSYNSVKCVTCHNSGLGKYFQVFSGWYLTVCILMVMFWLLHYNGPGYDKRYLMIILIKNLDYVASAK